MELKKDLKLIVFDFDGTLHTMSLDWNHVRQLLGIEGTSESVGAAVDRLKRENPMPIKELDNLERQALEHDRLDGKTVKALQILGKRYHIAVLSRNSSAAIREFLEKSKIQVELVVGRSDVDEMKPHPEGMERILKHFNVTNKETLMVGDTWHDFLLARNVGCRCVIIGHNFSHEIDHPEVCLSNMSELTQLLV